jgi:hypothetical protein
LWQVKRPESSAQQAALARGCAPRGSRRAGKQIFHFFRALVED